ncbi:MAG: exported protein of unknown function [Ignavibacteria bacterium]|nr:exported protein of unknown function [Ignavibacteria bacterium]
MKSSVRKSVINENAVHTKTETKPVSPNTKRIITEYQLKDHLGNNRVTFSDLKFTFDNNNVPELNLDFLSATNYYPFGMTQPGRHWEKQNYSHRFGYNGMEKDDEMKGLGNSLDFGARIYDSRLVRFMSMDKAVSSFPYYSPYLFAGNTPIAGADMNGDSLYFEIFVSGHKDKKDDETFKKAAETRKFDIEKSKTYDKKRDCVVILEVQNLEDIKSKVEEKVKELSPKFGQTVEFGLWSHSGIEGPRGSKDCEQYPLNKRDKNQMSINGWNQINFNWTSEEKGLPKPKTNRAFFYGCRTAVSNVEHFISFAQNISFLGNFRNVSVWGQSNYSNTSKYTNYRTLILDPNDVNKLYMVGEEDGFSLKMFFTPVPAYKMIEFSNGTKKSESYQDGDKK